MSLCDLHKAAFPLSLKMSVQGPDVSAVTGSGISLWFMLRSVCVSVRACVCVSDWWLLKWMQVYLRSCVDPVSQSEGNRERKKAVALLSLWRWRLYVSLSEHVRLFSLCQHVVVQAGHCDVWVFVVNSSFLCFYYLHTHFCTWKKKCRSLLTGAAVWCENTNYIQLLFTVTTVTDYGLFWELR